MTRDLAAEKRDAEELMLIWARLVYGAPRTGKTREDVQSLHDACEHWLKLDEMEQQGETTG